MTKKILKKNSKIPMYQQVKESISGMIMSGELKENDPLPSERSVGERFKISRMTARQALVALENDGLAYSDGRKGRFVSPKRLRYDIGNTVSFSIQAQTDQIDLSIELLETGLIKADSNQAKKLQCEEATPLLKYKRLFKINSRPAFIEEEYVIEEHFKGLLDLNLCQSSSKIHETHYNRISHQGDISIRMCMLSSAFADLLGLSSAQPGMELIQTVYDTNNHPICLGHQFWRGDIAEFSGTANVR